MSNNWSDDENENDNDEELLQPNRDFPISDEEEEEEEYDMYELSQLTINNQMSYNLKDDKNKKIKKPEYKNENKKHVLNIKKNNEKRKFNPRLPPPQKYNKTHNINFKLNSNDFPSL
jgi:hypothetical protein